jgi:hypothetical protein
MPFDPSKYRQGTFITSDGGRAAFAEQQPRGYVRLADLPPDEDERLAALAEERRQLEARMAELKNRIAQARRN